MARPPRNALAIHDFARSMAKLTRTNPATPKDIELWAYATLGIRVGQESIRKAMHGEIDPTQCAVELLLVLAAFYGVEDRRLGKFAADRLRPIHAIIGSGGPGKGGSRQGTGSFGCTSQTAGQTGVLALAG